MTWSRPRGAGARLQRRQQPPAGAHHPRPEHRQATWVAPEPDVTRLVEHTVALAAPLEQLGQLRKLSLLVLRRAAPGLRQAEAMPLAGVAAARFMTGATWLPGACWLLAAGLRSATLARVARTLRRGDPSRWRRRPAPPRVWCSAARLALGTAVALGLARFAYGLLVPAMRAELGWSLAQAGAMTTANGVGYLAGAVATTAVARRLTLTVTFRLGMVLTAAALAVTALARGDVPLLAARAAAGLTGALVFITGGVIASRMATAAGSAAPITVYFSGAGLGIAASGAVLPPLLDGHAERWPLTWAGMAAAAALATAVSWTAARADAPGHGAGAAGGRRRVRPLARAAAAYVLFAAGYIAFVTFLSAYLTDQDASTPRVTLTWTLLGVSAVVAAGAWNRPIAGWPGGRALAALLATLAGAAALPLLSAATPVVLLSTVAYGATFMGVPAAVTALVRTQTPPQDWTPTLAAFTVLFAAGQTCGPLLAGALADRTAPAAALAWTAGLCAAGAVFAAAQPARGRSRGTLGGEDRDA